MSSPFRIGEHDLFSTGDANRAAPPPLEKILPLPPYLCKVVLWIGHTTSRFYTFPLLFQVTFSYSPEQICLSAWSVKDYEDQLFFSLEQGRI